VLLKAGANITDWDKDGMTVLMYAAAENQNPEALVALLKASADAKAKDNAGKTALDYGEDNEKLKDTDAYRQPQEAASK